jgi:hypothetical protein
MNEAVGAELATEAPRPALALHPALDRRVWLEVLGWAVLGGAALCLRLAALGEVALGADEAVPALEAWRLWLHYPPPDLVAPPLLVHLLGASFALFAPSDVAARLPSALAGTVLALAPWLLRPWLGSLAALGAGVLLTLSPLLLFASRRADAAILVAALVALLVGAIARAAAAPAAPAGLATDGRRGEGPWWESRAVWIYAAAVLAALLLTAAGVALPAALAPLAAAALTWWPGAAAPSGRSPLRSVDAAWAGLRAVIGWRAVAVFAAVLVLVSTACFTYLRGLQGSLVDPWVSWLAPYLSPTAVIPWLPALVLYDLPLLAAAAAGLLVVARRNQPFDHFLLWWAALGALPLLFQPADPRPYLVAWAVPLALLGGVALGRAAELDWSSSRLGYALVALAVVVIDGCFLVNTLRFVLSITAWGSTPAVVGPVLAASGVALILLALLHWHLLQWPALWRAATPARVGTLAAVALGLLFVVTVNSRLNYAQVGPTSPELLRPEVLAPDVREIVTEMQTWARQEPTTPIQVDASLRPWLLWHLRDVATAQFATTPEPDRRGLWAAGPEAPPGERRLLRRTALVGPIATSATLWNWWLYRNSWLLPTRHDTIVIR